jgi:hypothetical protein
VCSYAAKDVVVLKTELQELVKLFAVERIHDSVLKYTMNLSHICCVKPDLYS